MKSVAEKLYFFLVFGEISGALAGAVNWGRVEESPETHTSNPILLACTMMVALGTAYFAYQKLPQLWRMLLQLRWIFLLYAWALLTIGWSQDRAVSTIAVLRLVLYLLSAGCLALRYTTEEFLHLFSRLVAVAAVCSVAAQFVFPHHSAAGDTGGGWTGLFPHKNTLGSCMLLGLSMWLIVRERWSPLRVAVIGLCSALLILSQSDTSILTALVASLFVVSQKVKSRTKALLCLSVGGMVCVLFLLSDPVELLFSAGGRDTSLTGRTAVWAFSTVGILQHPVLGYGYGTFWADSGWTLANLHWSAPHAHNGLLQVWLDLGGIGVVLTFALLANCWRRARRIQKYDRSLLAPWISTLLVLAFVHNLAESDFMSLTPIWYLIMLGSFSMMRRENERRAMLGFEVGKAESDLVSV